MIASIGLKSNNSNKIRVLEEKKCSADKSKWIASFHIPLELPVILKSALFVANGGIVLHLSIVNYFVEIELGLSGSDSFIYELNYSPSSSNSILLSFPYYLFYYF